MYKYIYTIIILTTVDKTEVEKFSKLAKDWWNPSGKFKPLHHFNPVRVSFIKEKLISYFNSNFSLINFSLAGLKICKGLNFPSGFHQSSAIFENFSISVLSTVVKMLII